MVLHEGEEDAEVMEPPAMLAMLGPTDGEQTSLEMATGDFGGDLSPQVSGDMLSLALAANAATMSGRADESPSGRRGSMQGRRASLDGPRRPCHPRRGHHLHGERGRHQRGVAVR